MMSTVVCEYSLVLLYSLTLYACNKTELITVFNSQNSFYLIQICFFFSSARFHSGEGKQEKKFHFIVKYYIALAVYRCRQINTI